MARAEARRNAHGDTMHCNVVRSLTDRSLNDIVPDMTTSGTSLSELGRNAGAAVLVLSSLAGGDKHGYALVKDVEEFAGVHMPPGTLYQVLARLESRGLILALAADDRRRPYRLTAQGATVLGEYITAQQRVLKTGQVRLRRAWSLA
jgi:DNA-binding PadR family transcriptional regulator